MRYAALLVGGSLLASLGAEFVTVRWLARTSQIERRTDRELVAASGLRDERAVLLVGNSLLDTGVDMKVLNDRIAPDKQAHRLVVENTQYYDWKYGLRSLLGSGSRPGAVVVVLSVRQLLGDSFRGDYSVYRLVRWQDVHRLAEDVECDRTRASGLYLARASLFYSSRAEIRSWLLGRLVPRFEDLRRDLAPRPVPMPADEAALAKLLRRLDELAAVTDGTGVRLIVVVPPALAEDGLEDLARRAAKSSPVPILVPLSGRQTTEADYASDLYHASPAGAVRFSEALAVALK